MRLHHLRLLGPLACAAALVAGCGGSGDAGYDVDAAPPEVDRTDERALAHDCITRLRGIEATLEGDDFIQVGEPPGGARLEFLQFSGEAEGRQLDGEAEGSEQIGSVLLFVNDESDGVLEELEECALEIQ